jgi:hypothetical protein
MQRSVGYSFRVRDRRGSDLRRAQLFGAELAIYDNVLRSYSEPTYR